MSGDPRAGAHSSKWDRLGTCATLALAAHATAALALPTLPAPPADASQLPAHATETTWLELDAVSASAATAGAAAAATAAPGSDSRLPEPPPRRPRERRALPAPARGGSALPQLGSIADVAASGSSPDAQGSVGSAIGEIGAASNAAAAAPQGAGAGQGTTSAARLLGAGDPCRGYFPEATRAPRGRVRLAVDVDSRGVVVGSQVLEVSPRGEGFSEAAQACAVRLRFVAAQQREGQPVRDRVTLLMRFERD